MSSHASENRGFCLVVGRVLLPVALVAATAACGGGSDSEYDSATVEKGAELVSGKRCATCHLSDLSGASVPYPNTQAYPPNLTPDDVTGLGLWTDEEIADAILDGVDIEGRMLCAAMPNYGSMGMTEQDAMAIVAYLRSLAPIDHAVPETESCRATP